MRSINHIDMRWSRQRRTGGVFALALPAVSPDFFKLFVLLFGENALQLRPQSRAEVRGVPKFRAGIVELFNLLLRRAGLPEESGDPTAVLIALTFCRGLSGHNGRIEKDNSGRGEYAK